MVLVDQMMSLRSVELGNNFKFAHVKMERTTFVLRQIPRDIDPVSLIVKRSLDLGSKEIVSRRSGIKIVDLGNKYRHERVSLGQMTLACIQKRQKLRDVTLENVQLVSISL